MSTTATIPDLKRGISLNAPPRRVPLLLRLQIMFGNVASVIGAACFLPILPVAIYGTGLVGGGPIPFVTFGFMGAVFIFGGSVDAIRSIRLLREGRLGWGTRSFGPITQRVGKGQIRILHFRFVDDKGAERTAKVQQGSTAAMMDEREEPLVYDQSDAMLLDEHYGRARIVNGAFVVGSRASLAVALGVLAVSAAFVGVCVGAALGWFPDPAELVRYID